ncbi:AAA family ATPase [bacterium]|nr:AAA family ATPase [bacterium]
MTRPTPPATPLRAADPVAPLSYDALCYRTTAPLDFTTTDDVAPDGDWAGQERALAALELGMRVRHAGYNIFVTGLTGTHRAAELAALLRRFTLGQPTPGDRVLVQNFRNPDRPRTLSLPAGWGARLRQDMQEMVEELRQLLPKTFRSETFEEEKERLSEQFGSRGEAISRRLDEQAAQAGFALQQAPNGDVMFIPLRGGRPITPEESEKLSDEERADLRRRQRELARQVKAVMREQQALMRLLGREVRQAERRVADEAITPIFDELTERYAGADVRAWLAEVKAHALDHLSLFQDQPPPPPPLAFFMAGAEEDALLAYAVNVLVDNSGAEGPPVIVETSPTYKNLFGAIERMVDRQGKLVTNFTRVVAGALLRAHGGCVIINLLDALSEPLVWRALKQTLAAGHVEIETYDPFALFATAVLKPEPMAIDTRVVLTGPPEAFQILHALDEEFRETFKIRADFGDEADSDAARRNAVAQMARLARAEHLPPFRADAVSRLLEQAARQLGDRRKVPSQWSDVADVMREAAFWARRRDAAAVEAADVQQAIAQRTYRSDRIEAKLRELIHDGVLLVDVAGERIGQVNGLAVLDVSGYAFGRPSRITAVVSMGSAGVIAIDREAKLSGRAYDKAVLIIAAYLRQTYARDFPLGLAASVCFEQSYSGIEGDSASLAELAALISALAEVPIRQDLALTGSVDQFGTVQPIGGVNEKIEGFFRVCRVVGLSGRQGVIIPARNRDNLILDHDVLDAVRAGTFHVYAVDTLDDALAILTGKVAGRVDEPGTIHHAAAQRLRALAEGLRAFARAAPETAAEPTDD